MPAGRAPLAIIGAGYSGSMLACLLAERGLSTTLIDSSPRFGPGLAYGTPDAAHLLNVRVSGMAARPDRPQGFLEFLTTAGLPGTGGDFVPRAWYGRFLEQQLAEAPAGRITRRQSRVIALTVEDRGFRLDCADGTALAAERVVLATGHQPMADPPGLGISAGDPRLIRQPWDLPDLPPEAPLLLLGTGLTAVDVLMSLHARGHRGPVTAISRRGLWPRPHAAPPAAPLPPPEPLPAAAPLSARLRAFRQGLPPDRPWQQGFDRWRPQHPALWQSLEPAERRRFLRHLRPWWEVHRHRMPPQAEDLLQRWQASGQLRARAGRIRSLSAEAEGRLRLTWSPRGGGPAESAEGAAMILATGGVEDPRLSRDPLLVQMLGIGLVEPDPLGLGLRLGPAAPAGALHLLGPPARGEDWELTAVPELRHAVWDLAARLAG